MDEILRPDTSGLRMTLFQRALLACGYIYKHWTIFHQALFKVFVQKMCHRYEPCGYPTVQRFSCFDKAAQVLDKCLKRTLFNISSSNLWNQIKMSI